MGMRSLHLVDESRADPWKPEVKRELMVSLWYPARKSGGKAPPYLTPQESALVLGNIPETRELPPGALATIRVHSHANAPARTAKGGLPLVVMSPGGSFPRATLTSLAEELASRGYLVAGVEHTYESFGTTFPDGETTTCLACDHPDSLKMTEGRVADLRFVLDRLTTGEWGELIDRSRIAAAGHSMGGNSAAHLMLADPRVRAAVNLDGTFFPALPKGPKKGPARPVMLIGNPRHEPDGADETWPRSWANLTGWKRWLTVDGAEHSSFVDFAVLGPQLGIPVGEIDGERALRITRAYLSVTWNQLPVRVPSNELILIR
ncbi:alpha/beta hydrolase [Nonomuraea sp. K274]|uniref:Alpha/beta hydrolase n=1 Tax=Nonomuraea cypriaca TaxID=1187855 RepID=A0A931AKI2_9ACTN|nr:alpha/beta hydrolase [Nonomuraea cypriaca]